MNLELFNDNVGRPAYYYPIIMTLVLIFIALNLLKNYLKKNDINNSFHTDDDPNDPELENSKGRISLQTRYLVCFLLGRACMWARAPYLYLLFTKLHKFSYEEMGLLFLVDKTSALIFSPIIGNWSDLFGRKLFSMLYGVIVVIHISLRLSVNTPCAYVSQALAGIGATILNTSFESWVNKESKKVFISEEKKRQKFLKILFHLQTSYDAMNSFIFSIMSACLFTIGGVVLPFIFSALIGIIATTCIYFLWDENDQCREEGQKQSYKEAFVELKKLDVFSIGLMESIFYAVLSLFIFSWTPILLLTSQNEEPNVGFVSLCFVLMTILGTLLFEIIIIYLKLPFYIGLLSALVVECVLFMTIYTQDSFFTRLICLSLINCVLGFYVPLNSIIKSNILKESHRALLMSMFRIPLNLFVVIILLFLRYISTLTVRY
jgi:MFS family permease